MPPFTFTPGMNALMQQWGTILSAVGDRLNTQQIYSAVYNAQLDAGLSPGGFTLSDMSQLRSLAVQQRNADAALASSPLSSPISGDMVGVAPWSNPAPIRNLAQSWEVRFQHTFTVDGVEQTQWRTTVIDGQLPGSVADLQAQVESDANDMATSYGVGHVGVGAISITAV